MIVYPVKQVGQPLLHSTELTVCATHRLPPLPPHHVPTLCCRSYSARLHAALKSLAPGDLHVKGHCDAIATSGPATADGNGSFFARDFQLATALVLQDLQTMVVYNPTDGRQPLVSVMAPGGSSLSPVQTRRPRGLRGPWRSSLAAGARACARSCAVWRP